MVNLKMHYENQEGVAHIDDELFAKGDLESVIGKVQAEMDRRIASRKYTGVRTP